MDSSYGNDKKSGIYIPDVTGIDINRLGTIYGSKGKNGPDYLKYSEKGRDIMSKLFFYTGSTWLGGFSFGMVQGSIEGWRAAANPRLRIKINSVLNAVTKRGSLAGNACATLAFIHVMSLWLTEKLQLDIKLNNEIATPFFAGIATGSVYVMSRGPRAAALGSVIGAVASCTIWYGGPMLFGSSTGKRRSRF